MEGENRLEVNLFQDESSFAESVNQVIIKP